MLSPFIKINNFAFEVWALLSLESTFPDGHVGGWVVGEADNNTSSAPAGLWLKLLLSLAI